LKILLIHYRYHSLSGPERYLFNLKSLLESKGHTIVPFSLKYDQNEISEFDKYFVEPLGDKNVFNYSKQENISFFNKLKIVKNFIYNRRVYLQLSDLIKNEKPDIAYVLQYFGKLTHAVFDSCRDSGIPAVLRLSDYGLICAKNIFFRDGQICTKCLECQFNSVKFKCIHNSTSKSILNYLALKYAFLKGLTLKIDGLVTPSEFMKELILDSKYFKNNNIFHIPTFYLSKEVSKKTLLTSNITYDFCYFGRLVEEKGLTVLFEALLILKGNGIFPKVCIAGDYNNEYAKDLIVKCSEAKLKNVEFVGLLDKELVMELVSKSKFSIVPSIWFDNMPNSLIESQSCGTPVIASNIGSLTELVEDGYNGYLFKPGNSFELSSIMTKAINQSNLQLSILKSNSLKWVESYCSEETHYLSLISLFNKLITKKHINV